MIDALTETERLPKEIIRGKGMNAPVFRALTTDENGETIEFNDQSTMVPIIAQSNRVRQQQCSGTPFMIPPLVEIFGHLANEEPAQQVKNGTFNIPEEVDPVVKDLIQSLKMNDEIRKRKEISVCITPKENTAIWKKMKDKTTSASGTPGFSHYKMASKIDDINRIETFLHNAPLQTGFTPSDWTTVTDLKIAKRTQ